jgi:hypothetical protein
VKDSTLFMDSSQQLDFLKCPFCLKHSVEAIPGKTTCPDCSAEFEIDDRGDASLLTPKKMRLPVNGMVCNACGIVQSGEAERCGYCGVELSTKLQ